MFGEKLYLSPILDLFNGEIIAHNIEKPPVFPLVMKMLDQAFQRLNDGDSPIQFGSRVALSNGKVSTLTKRASNYAKHVPKGKLLR